MLQMDMFALTCESLAFKGLAVLGHGRFLLLFRARCTFFCA
jgi:hypothetical protein